MMHTAILQVLTRKVFLCNPDLLCLPFCFLIFNNLQLNAPTPCRSASSTATLSTTTPRRESSFCSKYAPSRFENLKYTTCHWLKLTVHHLKFFLVPFSLRKSATFWSTWLESSWTRRPSSRLRFYNSIFSRKSWQTFSTLPLFQEILEKHFLRFHVLFSKIQPPIPPSPRSRRAWTRWWSPSGTWRNSRPASRCVGHDW